MARTSRGCMAKRCGVLLTAWLAIALTGSAQTPDVTAIGPKVGDRGPGLQLRRSVRPSATLKSLMGHDGRCWCSSARPTGDPTAKRSSWSCRDSDADLQKRGIGLAAISYDSPRRSRSSPSHGTSRFR